MTGDITIKITGDDVEGALRELIGQAKDTRPLMRAISETMLDSIEEAFENEANPETGAPWKKLSDSRIAQRTESGTWPGKMLQVSQGGLAASMTANSGPHHAAAGSNKEYAAAHHFGTVGKSIKIPAHRRLMQYAFGRKLKFPVWANVGAYSMKGNITARPYVGLTPEHRQEVLDIIQRHLRP